MWDLDYKESWTPKSWCFWTVGLEKTLESPLDCKEIQPVHPKGDQSWEFIGRTDVEAETPIFWPPDAKSWLLVQEVGESSRRWPLIPDERERPLWMVGQKVLVETKFLCGTQSFSLSPAEGKGLEGRFSVMLAYLCSNSFLMILLIPVVFDKP